MKCANPMPLSTEGSFEQIVNAGTSVSRQIKKVWVVKTFRTIVVLMVLVRNCQCSTAFLFIPLYLSVWRWNFRLSLLLRFLLCGDCRGL